MDDLYVFAYKLKSFSSSFFQPPSYYSCSHRPWEKNKSKEDLSQWIARSFADPKTSALIPFYMEVDLYKQIIGDPTFCLQVKIKEFLVLNAHAAHLKNIPFAFNDFCNILKINSAYNPNLVRERAFTI